MVGNFFLNFLFTVFLGRKFSDQTQVMISCRINTKLLIRDTKGVSGWLFPTTCFLFKLVQTVSAFCLSIGTLLLAG